MGDAASGEPAISTDGDLFRLVTEDDPFTMYTLFPRADSVTSGTLNGSTAHQPIVRVGMNGKAIGVLVDGSLPGGAGFPNGAVLFKQIIMNGQTVLYAVMYKDSTNTFAANGWLWAEYMPDGSPVFSLTGRGSGCVGCHAREQGPQHDYIRTFERQH
jgi:hypothetical protein